MTRETSMTRRLALAALLASSLAACEVGKTTTEAAAAAQCHPVGDACASNGDCCSYGCAGGVCAANPLPGGLCTLTSDCGGGMLCKAGACTDPAAAACPSSMGGGTGRDDADVCTADAQCCSGNCQGATPYAAGACAPNHPPVVDLGAARAVPFRPTPTAVHATVTDPDGDTFTWAWTVTLLDGSPAGVAVPVTATSVTDASFVADQPGQYLVRLTVTDGTATDRNRLTTTASVTLTATDQPPAVTLAASGASVSRNVPGAPVAMTGTAVDPNGQATYCRWVLTAPGAAPVEYKARASCGAAGMLSFAYVPQDEGQYTFTLEADDGTDLARGLVSSAAASFTSHDDAPIPALHRNPYYANLDGGGTATVTLDASPSTDPNGDAPLAFAWTFKDWPGRASSAPAPQLSAATGAQTTFTATATGTYVATVTVTDPAWTGANPRAGLSASADVTVQVGTTVKPLSHGVVDAEYAKTANKLFLVSADPAPAVTGTLFVYDLATGTETSVALPKAPRCVSASADGKLAAVGHNSYFSVVDLTTTPPTVHLYNGPAGDVSDIVLDRPGTGNSRLVELFVGGRVSVWSAVNGTAQGLAGVDYPGFTGKLSPTQNVLYALESYYSYTYLHEYSLGTSLFDAVPSVTVTGAPTGVFVHENGAKVFLGDGTMYDSALSTSGTSFYAGYVQHMDTISRGDAAVVSVDRVLRWDSALNPLTAVDTIPVWGGLDGEYHGPGGQFVFLEELGTTATSPTSRHVLVRSAATPETPERWGIATFTP